MHEYLTNILDIITKYFNDRTISTPTQYSLTDLVKPQAVEILKVSQPAVSKLENRLSPTQGDN